MKTMLAKGLIKSCIENRFEFIQNSTSCLKTHLDLAVEARKYCLFMNNKIFSSSPQQNETSFAPAFPESIWFL